MAKFDIVKSLLTAKHWKYVSLPGSLTVLTEYNQCEKTVMYKKTYKFKDFKEACLFLRYLALQREIEGQERFPYEQ